MGEIIENTQKQETALMFRFSTGSESLEQVNELLAQSEEVFRMSKLLHFLSNCSNQTGNYVKFLPEVAFCPALIDNDNQLIFLYRFIEMLDELLDYEEIREEYPTLSYSQIHGAISFLRRIAQFNILNVDIDEIEEEYFTNDQGFLAALRESLADQEMSRVLNLNE